MCQGGTKAARLNGDELEQKKRRRTVMTLNGLRTEGANGVDVHSTHGDSC